MRHAFLLCLVAACGGTVTVFAPADDGSGGAGNLGGAGITSVNAGGAPVTSTVSTTTNIGGLGPGRRCGRPDAAHPQARPRPGG